MQMEGGINMGIITHPDTKEDISVNKDSTELLIEDAECVTISALIQS